MCCEVEFFWEVCFKEGTTKLFLYVVFALFPRIYYQMADLDFLLRIVNERAKNASLLVQGPQCANTHLP